MSRLPLDQLDDAALLQAYAVGDVRAFEALLHRHRRPLFNFLLRSVRDPHRAEDLMQEVFLRIIQGAADFQGQAKFTTWMYTIARNLCVDHARKMVHRRHPSLDQQPGNPEAPSLHERIADQTPSTDRLAATSTLQERIAHAVESLPDEQREVFLMRQLQGLPFAEIASIVGISENTTKSRMRYALERLQQQLSAYEDYKDTAS